MARLLSFREIVSRTIDSVPTEYGGIAMRSRLEADFARHLDMQGISWVYEPEMFGPYGGRYLPDFQIMDGRGKTFVELKPTLDQAEDAKLRMPIIWETYPDAVLVVVCAERSQWFAAVRGEPWESWHERWNHAA